MRWIESPVRACTIARTVDIEGRPLELISKFEKAASQSSGYLMTMRNKMPKTRRSYFTSIFHNREYLSGYRSGIQAAWVAVIRRKIIGD